MTCMIYTLSKLPFTYLTCTWYDKSMYRIFIIEDDDVIAGAIADNLRNWGFEAQQCTDLRNVMQGFREYRPHLVLMDISLPFFNGYHWCSEIRKESQVPVMFISSAGDDMNIVMAISMGADDFVVKPFEMNVLVAKIQALLRRSYDFSAAGSDIREHNGMIFDSAACTAEYEGKIVELSRNENRILALLMEHKGRTVSREIIMNRLWESDAFIDENTLSVNINRLRKALASIGVTDLIETKKGIGYIIK